MKGVIAGIITPDRQTADIYLDGLLKLIRFNGEPAQFWLLYIDTIVAWCGAESGLIAMTVNDGAISQWKYLAFSTAGNRRGAAASILKERLPELYGMGEEDGAIVYKGDTYSILGIRCGANELRSHCLAAAYIDSRDDEYIREKLSLLKKLNDLPDHYRLRKTVATTLAQQEHVKGILDLMSQLNEHDKFLAVAMLFCNELASRHQCNHVSLGWYERGYVHVKAISHVDTFDKKMDAIRKLEIAMEESFDQNIEIVLPYKGNLVVVKRDNEVYARAQEVPFLCTLPLRIENSPVAICTLERTSGSFEESELRLLRLSCEQAVRRLDDLKKNDFWFGKLIVNRVKKQLVGLVGFEHIWAKTLTIMVSLAVCFICFVPVTYRLESTAIVRTDRVSFLTAPFDGHIEHAAKRIGDDIRSGDEILRLDKEDLLLQEAELEAEINRYLREAKKAEASGQFADMLIAQALRDQTVARREIVQYKINKATMHAPFNGIIVDGDLTERIGSPVKQGDALYKIMRLEGLFAELDIKESEIQNVKTAQQGELALASNPQIKLKIRAGHLEPAAISKKEGNVFVMRCMFKGEIPEWCRPGMAGVAKLNAGRRTLLWIISHRTVDFLRLKFWW